MKTRAFLLLSLISGFTWVQNAIKVDRGNCNFTDSETGKTLDELINWLKTGSKTRAGFME